MDRPLPFSPDFALTNRMRILILIFFDKPFDFGEPSNARVCFHPAQSEMALSDPVRRVLRLRCGFSHLAVLFLPRIVFI